MAAGDYAALRAAGLQPHLTVGPWHHGERRDDSASVGEVARLVPRPPTGRPGGTARPARPASVARAGRGGGEWRELPEWPVPGMREPRWHLRQSGGADAAPAGKSEPDAYRYDPKNPTPSWAARRSSARPAGDRQAALERRRDVLTYTSGALAEDLEIVGPVSADLFIRSGSRAHRLRRPPVRRDTGRRVAQPVRGHAAPRPRERPRPTGDGVAEGRAWSCGPPGTGSRRGHRIRVQVCSGASPRVARNPGTGEPIGTGVPDAARRPGDLPRPPAPLRRSSCRRCRPPSPSRSRGRAAPPARGPRGRSSGTRS